MGFMEPQITAKQHWLSIDGNCGTEFLPSELFDAKAVRAIIDGPEDEDYADKILAMVQDYCESTKAYSAELIYGYGVRSSAPGYMDCTPWTVYTNKREATKAYNEEKRECEGDRD
jgi:hypothetical protein